MYDYEDYYTEPAEAELIIDEAKSRLTDLLKKECKDVLDKVYEARKEFNDKDRLIREKEYKIELLNKQIEELENKKVDIENRHYPRKLINAMITELTGDFTIGQEVWVADYRYDRSDCTYCRNTGKVEATVGDEVLWIACPKCNGRKYVEQLTVKPKKTAIEGIDMKLCFDGVGNRVSYWSHDTITLTSHDERRSKEGIFATEEACLDYCEQKQRELNAKRCN